MKTGSDSQPSPWVPAPILTMDVDADPTHRLATVPSLYVEHSKALLRAIELEFVQMGLATNRSKLAHMLQMQLFSRLPRYQQLELAAVADLLGMELGDVLLANVSYDLVLSHFGCSTLALATGEGPVLARNMDWWPTRELARASVSLSLVERDGETLRSVNFGWFGVVGLVSGYSARGRFAVALNAVSSGEQPNLAGQPVLLWLRHVVETAADFEEAVRLLRDTPLVTGGLFTLVGATNQQRVVIERTCDRSALRTPDSPGVPLISTNDYRALNHSATAGTASPRSSLHETACTRFDRMAELTSDSRRFGSHGAATTDDNALLSLLADPQVVQTITAHHVIARPAQRRAAMWVPRQYLD